MLDTNVLLSALLFPNTKMNSIMNYIFTHHQLVLSSYVVDELKQVIKRKFPSKENPRNHNGIKKKIKNPYLWQNLLNTKK